MQHRHLFCNIGTVKIINFTLKLQKYCKIFSYKLAIHEKLANVINILNYDNILLKFSITY